jgi:hypothetical protein
MNLVPKSARCTYCISPEVAEAEEFTKYLAQTSNKLSEAKRQQNWQDMLQILRMLEDRENELKKKNARRQGERTERQGPRMMGEYRFILSTQNEVYNWVKGQLITANRSLQMEDGNTLEQEAWLDEIALICTRMPDELQEKLDREEAMRKFRKLKCEWKQAFTSNPGSPLS